MLLADLLSRTAQQLPLKTAAIFASEGLSYADLDRRSGQLAARLRRLGIGPGHRVAIVSENGPDALVYYWGVLKTGAASVDIPCTAGPNSLMSILEECRPEAIALSFRQHQRLSKERPPFWFPPIVVTNGRQPRGANVEILEEIVASELPDDEVPCAAESDVAMILYTSGTTGRAKGVMLSHQNVLSNLEAAQSLMQLGSDERLLLMVPFYFIHGRMQLLTHAMIGGTIIVSQGFQFPQTVLSELIEHRASSMSGVPYHFRALLDRTDLSTASVPDLRYVLITGGALPPDGLRELSAALPEVEIHIAYGQTEASPRVTYLGPEESLTKIGSSGRALPGVQIEIVNDKGESVAFDETGEVVVSGPNVMRGYVAGDERSIGVIDDQGRLHTGDLGRLGRDGHLYLVGRKSEMIKTAGERVFPAEIEQAIMTHASIAECAVCSIPDDLLGEAIVACVVPVEGSRVSADDLREHCLRSLPFVRVPKEIKVVSQLPKTASGKIDRSALKERVTNPCIP